MRFFYQQISTSELQFWDFFSDKFQLVIYFFEVFLATSFKFYPIQFNANNRNFASKIYITFQISALLLRVTVALLTCRFCLRRCLFGMGSSAFVHWLFFIFNLSYFKIHFSQMLGQSYNIFRPSTNFFQIVACLLCAVSTYFVQFQLTLCSFDLLSASFDLLSAVSTYFVQFRLT